jgi:hypothetical protein
MGTTIHPASRDREGKPEQVDNCGDAGETSDDVQVVLCHDGALMALASALSNRFRSKRRSSSRSASSAARVFAEIGFRFFAARRFVGTLEL